MITEIVDIQTKNDQTQSFFGTFFPAIGFCCFQGNLMLMSLFILESPKFQSKKHKSAHKKSCDHTPGVVHSQTS